MKRHLLFLCLALSYLLSAAQIEVLQETFGGISDKNIAGTSGDLGITNMTENMIDDWKTDTDGEEGVNAILVVFFENMSADDMKAVNISKLSNEKFVSFSDPNLHDMSGRLAKWFYIPASSQPFDITFSHPRYGGGRLIGVTMDKQKIYRVTLRAAATVSLNINSTPAGAVVYLDNNKVGVTPLTIPDTPMGKHTLSLTSPDRAIADNLASTVIDVSASAATFDYNLMKKRPVTFQAKPSKAELYIEKGGKEVGKGSGTFTLDNLEYGTYKIIGNLNGERSEKMLEVNEKTATPTIVEVIPSRSIAFTAIQNNNPVDDADVNINGEYIGKTPLTKSIEFGSYNVDMTYRGYHKQGKLKVDKNSNGRYELVLPNKLKTRHNPFNIDYNIREWGLAFNYINRCYNLKVYGQSNSYKFWGDDGHDSGLQLGITYQPYFGYGQGLNTGIYWQYFFGGIDGIDANYHEHSIFIPFQYQFRFPVSRGFSLFVNGGIGFNWGIEHTIKFNEEDEEGISLGYGHNEDYDLYFPKAINFSLLFGGGIQLGPIQLEVKFQRGLTDNDDLYIADEGEKVSCKLNSWSVGIAYMF